MAVRNFDGSNDRLTLGIGTMTGSAGQGANITFACLIKRNANGSWHSPLGIHASGGGSNTYCCGMQISNADDIAFVLQDVSRLATAGTMELLAADGWCILAVSHGASGSTPRIHKYVISTATWTHANATATSTTTARTPASLILGEWQGLDDLNGRMALVGVWNSALADVDIEALSDGLQAWLDTGTPHAIVPLTQAATSTAATDITGNGSNQTALAGTSVVTGDDPDFDWTLGGPVTGTGALLSPAVTLSGSGDVLVDGEGTITSPAGVLSGTGTVETSGGPVTGTGALTAAAGVLAGSGDVPRTGSGALTSPTGILAGVGSAPRTGAGNLTAAAGFLSGSGWTERLGTASLTSPPGVLAGSGAVLVSGAGALTSAAGVLAGAGAGSGEPWIGGTGALVSPGGTLAGSGTVEDGEAPIVPVSYTFEPPHRGEYVPHYIPGVSPREAEVPFGRLAPDIEIRPNVYVLWDGTVTEQWPAGGESAIRLTYHGAHVHTITDPAEAAILAAAGYDVGFEGAMGYGLGPYGSGPYGGSA